jgi:hypothetical protein
MSVNYEGYVRVLGEALNEVALKAKFDKDASVGTEDEDYQSGYLLGLHRVVTLMQQTAEIYKIPRDALGLNDLQEEDLI